MNRKAAVCIVFASFIILTEGNTVTLLPVGTADVISGMPLSLQCVYSGIYNPFTFNFYLNQDTNGFQIRVSNCMIASAVGYDTSLYNRSCGTNNVSLIILAVYQERNGQKWECDVSFITAVPIPPKASTIINVTAATTTSAPTTTTTIPCPVQFVVAFIPVLFIGCVIICIAVVIVKCKCKVCKDAHHLRLGLGLILGILVIVSCIIIVILKFTGTITSCEKEVGLGLGLGSVIPCLIAIIIAVIVKFFLCSLFKGTHDEDNSQELDEVTSVQTYVGLEANFSFMLKKDSNKSAVLIKNKSGGIVMIARGKVGTSDNPFYKDRVHFTGNTDEKLISFILRNVALSDAGIYIAVQSDANRTIGGQMLIVKEVSSIQTHVGSEANFNFMLTEDSNKSEVHIKNKSGGVVMIARGKEGSSDDPVYKGRVHFTGNTNQKLISFILRNVTLSDAGIYIADIAVHSDANRIIGCQMLIVKDTKGKTKNPGSSAVSREHVSVQMEIKGFKDDEEERPPAFHTGTQNKVDPSKQTKDRQQPVPPANTGFEDNPTFRPLPPPPQKGEIKDRNVRGISATIGDTQDLASETPRPNKLPPILLKQETVQEENVSEEPKKKRKKKKKKDQMNVETPEEENGETDLRLN